MKLPAAACLLLVVLSAASAGAARPTGVRLNHAPARRAEALPAPEQHVRRCLSRAFGWYTSWSRACTAAPYRRCPCPQPSRSAGCPSSGPAQSPIERPLAPPIAGLQSYLYDATLEYIMGGDPIEQDVAAIAAASCARVGPERCAANRAFVQQLQQHCAAVFGQDYQW